MIQTTHIAPVSSIPSRRHRPSQDGAGQTRQMFPQTPAGIISLNPMIYDRSRETDRVCPSCHRWYKFGEPERHWASFDEFLQRGPSSSTAMDTGQRQEQDLVGICSPSCLNAMVEDLDGEAGRSGKELRRSDRWLMRRTTMPEGAEAGLKIVWERINGA